MINIKKAGKIIITQSNKSYLLERREWIKVHHSSWMNHQPLHQDKWSSGGDAPRQEKQQRGTNRIFDKQGFSQKKKVWWFLLIPCHP